jgi:hypothetical protein
VKLLKFFGVPVAAFGLYFFYYWYFESYAYRYRVIVEVEVDGKVQSGSGIFETRWQRYPAWMALNKEWGTWATGEAPVVDLGQYGVLIATYDVGIPHNRCSPRPRSLYDTPYFAVSKSKSDGRPSIYDERKEKLFAALESFRGRYQLQQDEIPQFVWLADRADRLSAKIICPYSLYELHSSAKLRGVFVEMTRDRPDHSIYGKIPWLRSRIEEENAHPTNRSVERFDLMSYELLGAGG